MPDDPISEESKKRGKISSVIVRIKNGIWPFIEKGKEDLKAAQNYKKTQVWKSVFRHKLDDTPRTRSLAVLTNVFLHLHPAKINRDSVRFNFTKKVVDRYTRLRR